MVKRKLAFLFISVCLCLFLAKITLATVASSTSRVQYSCNGSVVDFAFTFGVTDSGDISVILTDSSDSETTLTETTDYTVACTNDDCSSGGTATTVSTYASGYKITIVRNISLTQESDFTESMPTLYETFESALDKITRILQQIQEEINRTVKFSKSSSYATSDITLPDPEDETYLKWDGSSLTNDVPVANSFPIYLLSNYASLSAAISTLNALNSYCTLLIDEDYTMLVSVSPDPEVFLQFPAGKTITTTGYILTIDSPANIIAQPNQQCFAGTGTVTFTNPGADHPGWWYSGTGSYHTAINYADASLPATGGTVLFPDGTYNCTAQLTPTSNHTWKSENKWQAKLVQQTTNTNLIYINDKDNVVIDGFYLEGDDTFSTNGRGAYIYESCNHVTVQNCYITKMGRNGVVAQQSASGNEPTDIIIRNNTIIENQGNGIFYNSVNGGEISGNYIINNGQSVGTSGNIGFGIVLDCYFLVDGCYNITVANNEILGNKEGGIQGLGLQGCVIASNTIDNSGDSTWDTPTAWDLCGINLRYKTSGTTLYPQNNIIANNTIRRSYLHGIYLSAALHTTVTGNNILDSGYGYTATTTASGIFCEHVGGQMANGNNIVGNNIRKTSASAYAEYAIYGDGLQACKVDSNQIWQGGDTAQISLNGDGTYNTIGTSCCNNTIYGVATEAATIVLTYFTDGTVDGNTVYNAGVLGISADANSINNVISQLTNKIHSASTADFSIAAPTTNNHIQERLLSITTVSFAADGDTTLYTVPTGYRCVLTKAIIVADDNANSTDLSIGQDGATTDWLPTTQMDNLDVANDAIIVMPVPNTTPTKLKSYAASTVIKVTVANHDGVATNTVYLYGILY